MDPTEPTSESLVSLANQGQSDLHDQLLLSADRVMAVVPSVTGISITKLDADGVALTLVATTSEVLPLDAMQYIDGGPCVDAIDTNRTIMVNDSDPLSEEQWSLFSRATASHGVLSSLSLPLIHVGEVVGSVNVYASEVDAFGDHVTAIAELFDAWAPGAVMDADLTFRARLQALETSQELGRRDALIKRAVGIVTTITGFNEEEARADLRNSAAKAGVTVARVARTVVLFHT